jgi:hypothetical protein
MNYLPIGIFSALAASSNMAVKGTRRTQALLKVGSSFGFVGFAKPSQPARP